MIKDSEICNYINLIKRLHKQKKHNHHLHEKYIIKNKQINKCLSSPGGKDIIDSTPQSPASLLYRNEPIKRERPVKTHVSDIELQLHAQTQQKNNLYGHYYNGIQKKYELQDSFYISQSFKKKTFLTTKTITNFKQTKLGQSFTHHTKKIFPKPKQRIERIERQTSTSKETQKMQKPYFSKYLSFNDDLFEKFQIHNLRIKTESTNLGKKKRQMRKELKKIEKKEPISQTMQKFDSKIEGWQNDHEGQLFEQF